MVQDKRSPAGLEPIQHANVIESVTEQLLACIRDGTFRPGDKLPSNRELAATLTVGRSTVREAIQRLVMLRVLEGRQGKGVFVRQPQSADAVSSLTLFALLESEALGDVLDAREVLEVALAGFAAERAAPADLVQIERSLDAEAQATDGLDVLESSMRFHLAIARAAHAPVIEKLFGSIMDLVLLYHRKTRGPGPQRPESLAQHGRVADAIARRDVAGARQAAGEHMAYNRRVIQEEGDAQIIGALPRMDRAVMAEPVTSADGDRGRERGGPR